jgi:putative ABC transport system permease protein
MAWRDSRRNRSRLLLFVSSVILGIAALVAISSFGEAMRREVSNQARTLLGADLVVEARHPFADSTVAFLESLGGERAQLQEMASMVSFPKANAVRLTQITVVAGKYPFYGTLATQPSSALDDFRNHKKVLIDKSLAVAYKLEPNDTVVIGGVPFAIAGTWLSAPGQAGITSSIAPVIYMPMAYLEETGLAQKGSRINFRMLYAFKDGTDVDKLDETNKATFERHKLRTITVSENQQNLRRAFDYMTAFLNLVGFLAMLQGCIGVASAVHIYLRSKAASVAILRCLGATQRQTMWIFLLQIVGVGILGSIIGASLGTAIQMLLPKVLADFLPITVTMTISWTSILLGIGIGVFVSILFTLYPLLGVRKISPLLTLRMDDDSQQQNDPLKWVIYGCIVLFITLFNYYLFRNAIQALVFSVGTVTAFGILGAISWLVVRTVKGIIRPQWSYPIRQALANLYRPNNQTLILIVTIGLGTALISTLFIIQGLLLGQISFAGSNNMPNMIIFDIQPDQKESVAHIVEHAGLPVQQQVPIVTMALKSLNGRTAEQLAADTLLNIPGWALNRENRVTYRDTLISSEKLLSGSLTPYTPNTLPHITLEDGYARAMHAKLGDTITFSVQGVPLTCIIGGVRQVAWNRIQTNFFIVFPSGVLEQAPQMHVLISRSDNPEKIAELQRTLIDKHPNVSLVDLTTILRSADQVLSKVSFVITFMALFSIFTGIVVLIGSVLQSRYQRIKESVLLRTIGATRKHILTITAYEYLLLGSIASLTGIVLALVTSWLLCLFVFHVPFTPRILPIVVVLISICTIALVVGILNIRGILRRSPLEVLRAEV